MDANLTKTEQTIVDTLSAVPAYTPDEDHSWRRPKAACTLCLYELVEAVGKTRATVAKAVRSLSEKNIVDAEERHGKMSKYADIRLRSQEEREELKRRADRYDAGRDLEKALLAEQRLSKWSSRIGVSVNAEQDDDFDLSLRLDNLSAEQCRAVLAVINQTVPEALKAKSEDDD